MKPEKVYACFNKDKDVRLSSSSPRDGQSAFRVLMFFQLAYSHQLLYNNR